MLFRSIRKYAALGTYEIIIIDNASTDETRQYLKNQSDVKVILNEKNEGFPRGCNQGIAIATGRQVLLLNNDTMVTPNWLENMLACLYSEDTVGAVGPVTNNITYMQRIHTTYQNDEEMLSFATAYNQSDPSKWHESLKLIGYCMLIKKSVIAQIGNLDEQFSPGNYEDDDYSMRMIMAGYKLMICRDTFIHHYGSVSFSRDYQKYNAALQRNAELFKEKWGFYVTGSFGIRADLVNLMELSDPAQSIRVLEVGCRCGGTLLQIRNTYKNAQVYGIEQEEALAKIAKQLATIIENDIEEDLPYEEAFFDFIILGDVLEHLKDPWETLSRLKKYVKPGGKIIASIPNMMHYSVLMPLIQGKWQYTDSGILDRRHLRFFTLEGIYELFRKAGLKNVYVLFNRLQDSEEDMKKVEALAKLGEGIPAYQYYGYQYLVRAEL